MPVKIKNVSSDGICSKKGIKSGDVLLSINGNDITDVLDYSFYLKSKKVILAVKQGEGKSRVVSIHKKEDADIGLEFDTYLMDKQHSCKNKCIFCFIDQLPKGLRDSLYFKDDDSRMSFLFGNYITLTNLTDREVERIIKMHISPVNISVHTMNPELRVKMMANPHAGESLKYLYRLANAGTRINAQIVCCPGINDGKELEFSLRELYKFYPSVQSVAVVPVGLTEHRQGLYPLRSFDKDTAKSVIDIINSVNDEFFDITSEKIVYAADEFFLKAHMKMPEEDYYNGYPQIENGVGMWTSLKNEFIQAINDKKLYEINRKVTVVTGKAAYPLIKELADMAQSKFKKLIINVVAVENRLFGPEITVSGLLCGADIEFALKDLNLGDEVIIPPNCLRNEGDLFLDDMSRDDLEKRLNVSVRQNLPGGYELLAAFLGE